MVNTTLCRLMGRSQEDLLTLSTMAPWSANTEALSLLTGMPEEDMKMLGGVARTLVQMLDMDLTADYLPIRHAEHLMDLLVLYASVSDGNRQAVEVLLKHPPLAMSERRNMAPFRCTSTTEAAPTTERPEAPRIIDSEALVARPKKIARRHFNLVGRG